MKLDIGGEETIQATVEQLWSALNDPLVLTRCIPGCKTMTEIAPDNYKVEMQLRVAAVGGSFEGEISLFDKLPPNACSIKVSGAGTLGHGNGSANFEIIPEGPNVCRLKFQGVGEIGGLVAGVGQRILTSVSKHLVGKFFTTLRKEFDNPVAGAAYQIKELTGRDGHEDVLDEHCLCIRAGCSIALICPGTRTGFHRGIRRTVAWRTSAAGDQGAETR